MLWLVVGLIRDIFGRLSDCAGARPGGDESFVLKEDALQPPAVPDRMSFVTSELCFYTRQLNSAIAPECAFNRLGRSSFGVFGFG